MRWSWRWSFLHEWAVSPWGQSTLSSNEDLKGSSFAVNGVYNGLQPEEFTNLHPCESTHTSIHALWSSIDWTCCLFCLGLNATFPKCGPENKRSPHITEVLETPYGLTHVHTPSVAVTVWTFLFYVHLRKILYPNTVKKNCVGEFNIHIIIFNVSTLCGLLLLSALRSVW